MRLKVIDICQPHFSQQVIEGHIKTVLRKTPPRAFSPVQAQLRKLDVFM